MSRFIIALTAIVLFIVPSITVYGQVENPSASPVVVDSTSSQDGTGSFCTLPPPSASITAAFSPTSDTVVSGTELTLTGEVTNKNPFSVSGTLYARVFFSPEGTQEQDRVVDQFVVSGALSLDTKATLPVEHAWIVPPLVPSGDYYISYYFVTKEGFELLGNVAQEQDVASFASFTVLSDAPTFLPANTTVNGEPYNFSTGLSLFDTQAATVSVTLTNPTTETVTLPVQWQQAAGTAVLETRRTHTQTELVTLLPNESKVLSYAIQEQSHPHIIVSAKTEYKGVGSFVNVVLTQDVLQKSLLTNAGLVARDGQLELYGCVDFISGNTDNSSVEVLLVDDTNTVLKRFSYADVQTGKVVVNERVPLPENLYNATLRFITTTNGSVSMEEEVSIKVKDKPTATALGTTDTLIQRLLNNPIIFYGGVLILILLLVLVWSVHQRLKGKTVATKEGGPGTGGATALLALLFVVSFFVGVQQVEASTSGGVVLGVQLSDYNSGLCGQNSGPQRLTPDSLLGGSSAYAYDTQGSDFNCGRIYLDRGIDPLTSDVRFCVTAIKSTTQPGAEACTPWASSGGGISGWARDGSNGDIDGARLRVETRPMPVAGQTISNLGFQWRQSKPAGTCTEKIGAWGVATNGAWSNWITDSNAADSNCIQIQLTGTVNLNGFPNPPSITGPTSGLTATTYSFSFQASDPDGDQVRYQIDWDNNGTSDATVPSGYVNSNTSQSATRSWGSPVTSTFQARTEDDNGATSGWTSHTVTISNPPTPTADLVINGQTSDVVIVNKNQALNLSWSSTNAASCSILGANLPSGALNGQSSSGSYTVTAATQSDTYVITCNGATDSVAVTVTNQGPNIPTMDGPTTGMVGTSYTFGFTAADPDGDQIAYEVDWNNDGVVDSRVPSSGLVNSNTRLTNPYTWGAAGTYTFQARTVDSGTLRSGWAAYSIIISPVTTGTCGTANTGTYTTAPTANQCSSGTLAWTDQFPTDGQYNWSCAGSGGGATNACVATVTTPTQAILTPGSCGTGNISASWSAVSGATSYDIQYRATGSTGAWTSVTGATSPLAVNSLTTGASYDFQLRYKVGALTSPWSVYATAAAPGTCAQTNVTAVSLTRTGTLEVGQTLPLAGTVRNNSTVTTGVGFSVAFEYRIGDSGVFTGFSTQPIGVLTAGSQTAQGANYPIPVDAAAQNLYLQYCVDTTGSLAESDESIGDNCEQIGPLAIPPATPVPAATPQACGTGAINITWPAVTGATGYDLQYQTSPSGAWTVVSNVSSPRPVTLLTPGVTYNFQVRSKTAAATSAWSAYATAAAPVACVVVVNGICGTSQNGTDTTAPTANQCSSGTLAWTDQFPTDGQYNWNCVGSGGGATNACVATVTSGPTPTATPGSCGTGEMSVSWSAVSGATGYDVQYQTSPSGAWIVVSNVTSPYTVSGLTTGVSYNFQIRHKAGTLISPWSAYATAAAPSACVVSACSPPASNLSLVVGVQAADGSACNNRVGLPQYTPNVALGGLSAWAYDTGGADMTCSKLCASPGPVSKDSRFCVQVLNNGVAFSQQCTGWASEGGGWSAYSPGKDNDQVRVNVENRDMPVGQTLNNVSVGIQLAKGVSGACNIVGAARYTPVGGGDSGWALDGSSGDYDCARVYITGVVSSSNLISENLIKTSGTVQEGQTLNFTASARNNGANATGVGFSDVFEYRYVDNTGAFSNIKTEANSALAAGVTNGDSASYVIPAGRVGQILYIQHCVDSTNAVGESNETVADQCEQINLGTVSAVPVVSASVTAPDCTIVSGGSSCGASVSWTSANVTSPFSVRQGGVQFSTVANSVGIVRTINYGVNTFTFHHNSGVQLATDNAMAACVGGTAWNGTSCTTVPGVVTGLTATPQACASGDITLTWNAVSGSSGYDIQIDGGAWTNLGNVTTYNHLNQVAGSAHTYNVRAWNAAGAGTAATVSSTIPSDCPGTLTVTAGACDTNQISSSWAAVSGATGYDLQYQLSPSGAWTVLTSVTSPRIVSGLNPGSAYNFQVRAKNAGGVSAWSSYGTTNAPAVCAPAVPAVPINLSATPQACGTNRLTLDWSDAANAASYSVYYSSGTFVGNSVGSNYTFTGTANQSYTFYVRSNNSVGVQSANSATFSGTVPGACPVPAASISGSACFIQAGANSCVANTVTWSSSNVTSPISVRQDGVQFATNANQPTAVSRTIPYGTATFTFHHNGGTQVGSQHQISASCIASAPWSTALGMCVAAPINPGLSLSVSPTVVRGNQTATITWSLTTPYSMSCTVFGPKIATVTFDPINAAAPNNIVTGPITAKSEYFFRCTSGSVTWTDSAVVEVVGVIEEI